MSSKTERQAAREAVAAYHEGELRRLLDRVGGVVERLRADEIDVFDADAELFQYSRAAKELWKFCTLDNPMITSQTIRDTGPIDWWARGAFRRR